MERRFGHDFGAVRVHSDEHAAEAASQLSAAAFTVGRDMFFGTNRYAPRSFAGLGLLAHELAHTLGETSTGAIPLNRDTRFENAAARIANAVQRGADAPADALALARRAPATVYRTVLVDDPTKAWPNAPGVTNASIVNGYVTQISSAFRVNGDKVEPVSSNYCTRAPRAAVRDCLCNVTAANSNYDWSIIIDDSVWPHTKGPETPSDEKVKGTVTVPSPYSGVEYGAWTSSNTRFVQPNWRIFAHELCGHANLMENNQHPKWKEDRFGYREWHFPTINAENAIAAEVLGKTADVRGTSQPHGGESFAHFTLGTYPKGKTTLFGTQSGPLIERIVVLMQQVVKKELDPMADIIGHASEPDSSSKATTAEPQWKGIAQARAVHVKNALIADSKLTGTKLKLPLGRFEIVRAETKEEHEARAASGLPADCVDIFLYSHKAASGG